MAKVHSKDSTPAQQRVEGMDSGAKTSFQHLKTDGHSSRGHSSRGRTLLRLGTPTAFRIAGVTSSSAVSGTQCSRQKYTERCRIMGSDSTSPAPYAYGSTGNPVHRQG